MDNEQKRNVIKITHKVELLIWLVIILLGVMIFSFLSVKNQNTNKESDYQLFINDVDGLIVGSPVRMMGMEVGYVTQIKPIKNEVFVNFRITEPKIYIPQGTQITVEFTGLAGSKSLELYPPDKTTYIDKNTPLLEVLPPKRLNDALGMLSVMYKKLMSVIYVSSKFGKDVSSVVDTDINIQNKMDMSQLLEHSNKIIDNSNTKLESMFKNNKRKRK